MNERVNELISRYAGSGDPGIPLEEAKSRPFSGPPTMTPEEMEGHLRSVKKFRAKGYVDYGGHGEFFAEVTGMTKDKVLVRLVLTDDAEQRWYQGMYIEPEGEDGMDQAKIDEELGKVRRVEDGNYVELDHEEFELAGIALGVPGSKNKRTAYRWDSRQKIWMEEDPKRIGIWD